jgi:hypothetical protein
MYCTMPCKGSLVPVLHIHTYTIGLDFMKGRMFPYVRNTYLVDLEMPLTSSLACLWNKHRSSIAQFEQAGILTVSS